MSELGKRVLVSLIFIPILIAALYFGGLPLVLMFLLVSVLGGLEYFQIMQKAGNGINCGWLWLSPALYLSLVYLRGIDLSLVWISFFIVILIKIFSWSKNSNLNTTFSAIWGLVYTGIIPAMIVRIGLDYHGQYILLGLVLMIWIVDSVAYFIGMSFGRHRGVTAISPRKSIEGFIAGALAPALIVFILYITGFRLIELKYLVLIAIAAGIVGQLGDLTESMIKRFAQVKDSSNLIPGHGGILDRTDSILLAGSFLYCAIQVLEKVR